MQNSDSKSQYKDNQPKAKRQKSQLGNAIPLTITFCVLVTLVVFGHNYLAGQIKPATITYVSRNDAKDEQENDVNSFETVKLNNDEKQFINNLERQYLTESEEVSAKEIIDLISNNKIITNNRKMLALSFLTYRLLDGNNYIYVRELLQQVTSEERIKNGLAFSYAYSLSKLESNADAIAEYRLVLQDQPKFQKATINLGLLLLNTKNYSEAYAVFNNGLGFVSGVYKSRVYMGLADSSVGLKELEKAISYYQKSIEYNPTSVLAWRKLARTQHLANMSSSIVIDSYKKSVALSPKNTQLIAEYSDYLFSFMQFEEVIILLRKNFGQSKASLNERVQLVVSYLEVNKPANARKQFNYLNKHIMTGEQTELVEAFDKYLKGDYRRSLNLFKSTLKKNRDNNLAYYMIGRAYLELNKPYNASVYLEKVSEDSLYALLAQYRLGLVYTMLNQTESAQLKFNSLMNKLPQSDKIAYAIAELAYKEGSMQLATNAMSKAILSSFHKKNYRLLDAKIKWRIGEKNKAIEELKILLQAHPKYKPALYRLADYQYQLNKNDEALTLFEELMELDPDYSNVEFRIAELLTLLKEPPSTTITLIQTYLLRRSEDVAARLFYAQQLCKERELESCNKQLQLVLKLQPENTEVANIRTRYFKSVEHNHL